MSAYQQLTEIFTQLSDLEHLRAITSWDEAVMMPTGGGAARAKAMATLAGLSHNLITSEKVKTLLAEASTNPPNDSWAHANLNWMHKHYLSAACVPEKLVAAMTEAAMSCEQAWRKLRAENDWQGFLPLLETTFNLVRESATIRGEALNLDPFDVLLDEFSPGVNQALIDPIFAELKATLPSLVSKIQAQQKPCSKPSGEFSIEKQRTIGLALMQAIGFNFEHGRLDVSHHPFCGGIPDDVRITTRYETNNFITAAMDICHETGHACYEQNLPKRWRNQPVGKALGMSMHESQSLLIEMQACRSREFMEFMAPLIQQQFGNHDAYQPDNLFQLYTNVSPNYIRVDADEVTYPLHVILRYEIERDLFSGNIRVVDLPAVWDEKMQSYLGLSTENNYRDGVMQDVHWPAGIFGYFPAYTLGRLIAAQLYQAALTAVPTIPEKLRQGDFTPLMTWLKQNVHERASSVGMQQILKDATTEELSARYFIDHINRRYLQD